MKSQLTSRATVFASWALGVSALLGIVAAAPRAVRWVKGGPGYRAVGAEHQGPGRVHSGTERIAYFIASSTCGASVHPRLPAALAIIRRTLAERAQADGKHFVYAGVALDERPETGVQFLKKFGPFDEILTGGSWFGTGAVDLLIRGSPGPLAMPQIVIVERDVQAKESTLEVGPDRVVSRIIGFAEIFAMAGLSESGEAKVAMTPR